MDHLAPSNVPVYETLEEGRALWQRYVDRQVPVVVPRTAVRFSRAAEDGAAVFRTPSATRAAASSCATTSSTSTAN